MGKSFELVVVVAVIGVLVVDFAASRRAVSVYASFVEHFEAFGLEQDEIHANRTNARYHDYNRI